MHRYIFGVIEVARAHPELIVFLDIFDDVKLYRNDFHRVQSTVIQRPTTEIDTQTELHPVTSCIDQNYTWNVWDFRRKAIQLANIRKCQTTSAQTFVTFERFGVSTQMSSPGTDGTQTRADAATNVPRPQVYCRNIRGVSVQTDAKFVNLTRPIDE